MKKVFLAGLATVLLLGATTVNAMTEKELKDKLTASYTINGVTVKASDAQITEIDRYLKEYDVSSKDAKYISGKIDEAVKYAKENKITSFTNATAAQKAKLVSFVADVNDNTSVKAQLGNDGVLTVFDENGDVFTKITNPIKYTNYTSMIAVVSVISLAGVAVITKKVAKANA